MVRGVRCFAALSMTRGCAVAGATTTNRHVILNGVKNLFLTDGRMRDLRIPRLRRERLSMTRKRDALCHSEPFGPERTSRAGPSTALRAGSAKGKNLALSEHKGGRCFADPLAEFVLREAEGLRAGLTTIGEDHDR
jgi:hypothetical protein